MLTARCNLFSLYPDYTVGPGITPGLLTLPLQPQRQALAGYAHCTQLPPVGNRTPP
jgi:hypothetical protein